MADPRPCMFCGQTPMVLPRTCDKNTPYNPADRAFPVIRCRCGISLDGEDWKGPESVIARWNALAMRGENVPALDQDSRRLSDGGKK